MEKIAIIGLSCLFPGAETPAQYWQNLIDHRNLVSTATSDQMGKDNDIFYHPQKGQPDKYYLAKGGFVRNFQFDPHGYRLAPETLQRLDNVFQWPLYVARHALEDGGYWSPTEGLAGCGLILGNLSFPTKASHRLLLPIYHRTVEQALGELLGRPDFQLPGLNPLHDQPMLPHNVLTAGYPAAVVRQALGLGRAHLTLDAACASSLYSVKVASDYLLAGKADLMLAGAVSAADPLFINMGFSIFQAYPENGISRPLDQSSGGLIAGEGAGMFLLKRYSEAVRDGDKIYAVIQGIGLSNDGRGKHFLSPNQKGQKMAFERAYATGQIEPATISYVECHATGTKLGDINELNSMDGFFGSRQSRPMIGSAKSNLGHMLTNAGMAGMTKVILSMANNLIPPTIEVTQPLQSDNKIISSDLVVSQNTPWPETAAAKRAGVSAFGFGGTNAHLILESDTEASRDLARQSLSQTNQPTAQPALAIVGMEAFFGPCATLNEFKQTIYTGQQHINPVPPHRWKGIDQNSALLQKLGFEPGQAPRGAYIDSFEIDFMRFRIPPNDTDQPDPQQLLTLRVADRALQHAGFDPQRKGANVAVLVAMSTELSLHQFRGRVDLTWQIREELARHNITLAEDKVTELINIAKNSLRPEAKVNQYISFIGNIMASRVASHWDFSGPAFTISAEENSTFRALEVAQMLLANNEVEAVVVAAVDLAGGMENIILRQQLAPVNTGQPTLSFDQSANGWLVGEGAGAVVVKRLDTAQTAGDSIYGVIEAISFNHEGRSAWETAGRTPAEIGYVELNSSGLPGQDEAEQAICRTDFSPSGRAEVHPTAIGSVKANIGHTFTASGMASLLKTVVCLHHRFIPAAPNWTAPQSPANWADTPFYVPTDSRPWLLPVGLNRRLAVINSLASDGSQAQMIVSENPAPSATVSDMATLEPFYLFPVSGNQPAELVNQLQQLQTQLDTETDLAKLAAQTYTTFNQQTGAAYTVAILAGSLTELRQELQAALTGLPSVVANGQEWKTPRGSYFTPKPKGKQGQVAFVYPGAFNGYVGLGQDLMQLFPEIYDQFGQLISDVSTNVGDSFLFPRTLSRLSEADLKAWQDQLLNNSTAIMAAGTSYSILVTLIMRDYLGLKPDIGLGYSLGEFTMPWAMGAWTEGDRYNAALQQSPLFTTRLSGPKNAVREFWGLPPVEVATDDVWGSFVIKGSPAQVEPALNGESKVYLTHINTPQEVIIAGDPASCQRVIDRLGLPAQRTPFNDVLHCEPLRTEQAALADLHRLPVRDVSPVRFYSTSVYGPIGLDSESIAQGIANCLSHRVDFPRLINRAYDDGIRFFIELGPRGTCSRWINEILAGRDYLAASVNKRGMSDQQSVLRLVAQLVSHQVSLDLSRLYPQQPADNQKRGLIKKITLGGPVITEQILAAEHQANFATERANLAQHPRPTEPAVNRDWWDNSSPSAEEANSLPLSAGGEVGRGEKPQPQSAAGDLADYSPIYASEIPPLELPQPHQPSHIIEEVEVNKVYANGSQHLPTTAQVATQSPAVTAEVQTWYTEQRNRLSDAMSQSHQNHRLFLANRHQAARQLNEIIQTQIDVCQDLLAAEPPSEPPAPLPAYPVNYSQPTEVVWDEADLLEFAGGDISKVFGEEFKVVDGYLRKVRLPLPPYLLVSRVTELEAKVGQFKPSFIQTEYDIPIHGWYCTDGQAPSAVAVESGQCDLLLISYLGVDFENKSNRVYRLLDCTLTFMDDLPVEGQTLRYDISINAFARTAGPLLFFFSYNCYVENKLILKMRGGCAGFFTQAELDAGKGVIYTEEEIKAKENVTRSHFEPLLHCSRTSFSEADLRQLCAGQITACFGEHYDQGGLNPSLRLPPADILMVDRVPTVDPTGGAWGLGLIVGEKIIEPDHWYFPCHFKDDEVLAGSLIAEGCVQLMQFYMLYLGLQTRTTDARFQPIRELPQVVRCRGETTPCSDIMTYRMEVTEIGLEPNPYAKANVQIIFQGRIVVDFQNLSLQLHEKSPADPYTRQKLAGRFVDVAPRPPIGVVPPKIPASLVETLSPPSESAITIPPVNYQPRPALVNDEQIKAFATGRLTDCFGEAYAIYDDRRAPRTPNGYLQLFNRVVDIRATHGEFKAGSQVTTEYDVPPQAWYYTENNYPTMPYSILMEIGLQPCGFLSAYMGSTFPYAEEDLYFRNLDGHGTYLKDIDLRGQTISNTVSLISSVSLSGIIIQKYNFELSTNGEPFYRGFASFGYFTPGALKNQVGLDNGRGVPQWYTTNPNATGQQLDLRDRAAQPLYRAPADKPHYRLAGPHLNFLDEALIIPGGGEAGQGYIYANRTINPADWFFEAHFHQDPVMPGSLGVEAILQAMQIYVLHQGIGADFASPYFDTPVNHKITWKYRGQIVRPNKMMHLEVHISRVEQTADQITLIGRASLWRDHLRIYEVSEVALAVREAGR